MKSQPFFHLPLAFVNNKLNKRILYIFIIHLIYNHTQRYYLFRPMSSQWFFGNMNKFINQKSSLKIVYNIQT